MLQAQRLELLGHLAGGVAHDFNNLLAVIAGYCDRLGSQLPATKRYESVAAIGAAAQRGSSLVRQLLAFSRPQPVELGLVDINSLVREFAPMLRRVIGEDVELEVLLERGRLPVEAHPVQIDQILMNLVVNARDAMPYGGRLTITTGTAGAGDGGDAPDGDAALIIVSDTGCGMDAATQARIFEPFYSTKEPGKGSGLGLATASGIVRQAGGSIAVSSVPGAGTTFTIRLPLAAAQAGSESDAFVARAPAPRGRARPCSSSRTSRRCASSRRSCSARRATTFSLRPTPARRWSRPRTTGSTRSSSTS